jgi:prolyl oligopeptidase
MKRFALLAAAFLLGACAHNGTSPATAPGTTQSTTQSTTSSTMPATPRPTMPITAVRPITETLHGVTVTDNYRWLEEQQSPETRAWINAQNSYTDAMLANLPAKQKFAERLGQLLNVESVGTPEARGNRYFYSRRKVGEDLASIYMREGLSGTDQLLVDPAPLSADHTTSVSVADIANDGKLLAYNVRKGGVDETDIHFYDVDSRKDLGDVMPGARYSSIVLMPNHRDVFYARFDSKGPRLMHHVIGRDLSLDETLFGQQFGGDTLVYLSASDDARWLLISVLHGSAATKTELYVKDLSSNGPIVTVVDDLEANTSADFAGDSLVLQTNWNAPNNRVFVAPLSHPSRANWREIIPESKSAALQSITVAGGKLFAHMLENVRLRITAYDLTGKSWGDLSLPNLGSVAQMNGSWNSNDVFFNFSSIGQPPTIYHYSVDRAARDVFFAFHMPVDPAAYTIEQLFATSKDGTRVPMFVFYRNGLPRNGNNPVLMTGYGGFKSSQLPNYSSRAIAWADMGGVYVLTNLRGGSEYGDAWHRGGMLEQKQHTFDDFIACGESLIANHFTSPAHLSIVGGSNGGLLVSAALTQRPDLFRAVVCDYPLIDMLRYDKFLVGRFWVPEYGSADDPEQFRWIYAYSPYQHVTKGTNYPAVLFVSGDGDTRVAPLHARKMTALMQASTGSSNPILLRYYTAAGHSGGMPLKQQVESASEELAFLWQQIAQ